MRHNVENPDITQLNEIMKKYIDIHDKKYELHQDRYVLKVRDNQYLTCKIMLNLD